MTAEELRTSPLGTRVRLDTLAGVATGEIVKRWRTRTTIKWDGGDEWEIDWRSQSGQERSKPIMIAGGRVLVGRAWTKLPPIVRTFVGAGWWVVMDVEEEIIKAVFAEEGLATLFIERVGKAPPAVNWKAYGPEERPK